MSDTEAWPADEAPHTRVAPAEPEPAAPEPAETRPADSGPIEPEPFEPERVEPERETSSGDEPSWWHRSHPTFAALVGFFTGVAYVIIVPGLYAAVLGLLFSDSTAKRLFPLAAFALVIPLGMLVPRRTRRFAQFMLIGLVSTALVIVATTALVLWVMFQIDG